MIVLQEYAVFYLESKAWEGGQLDLCGGGVKNFQKN